MDQTTEQKNLLLTDVLADVSRAFYLSIWVLPSSVREPIGVAYLLARAADTLADNPQTDPQVRLADLEKWQTILASKGAPEESRPFWDYLKNYVQEGAKSGHLAAAVGTSPGSITKGEGRLLMRLDDVYSLYLKLDFFAQQEALEVVSTLIEGMKLDLRSFPGAFTTDDQLENYTYLVAGCVGQFWSRITAHYLYAIKPEELPSMESLGVNFGKALQYVNVLRDMPRDIRCGRLYVPCPGLEKFLSPAQQNDAELLAFKVKLRPWIDKTLDHFYDALRYIQKTPKTALFLRLSTIWPVAIGLGTLLEMASSSKWPTFSQRVKVSRLWVYTMMAISLVIVWSNSALSWAFSSMRQKIDKYFDLLPQ